VAFVVAPRRGKVLQLLQAACMLVCWVLGGLGADSWLPLWLACFVAFCFALLCFVLFCSVHFCVCSLIWQREKSPNKGQAQQAPSLTVAGQQAGGGADVQGVHVARQEGPWGGCLGGFMIKYVW
jgi:Na+(H+)/acetate symporter ActP